MTANVAAMANPVLEAIVTRASVRAFLPTPVSRETVERILEAASRAPSGVNHQPWKVHVLTGEPRQRLCVALVEAHFNRPEGDPREYVYSPSPYPEPYKSRQREVGWALYGLLGIEKGDREATLRQHARNYRFFDAPVGMIFTMDRILERGSWLDYGMFLQNIMVAARGEGLHTCPQVAFAKYNAVIREHLAIPPEELIVCGMALGHRDPAAVENGLVTTRVPVAGFTAFHGW